MRYYNDEASPITISSGGIGLCSILTIVFVILKLCKVINWAWVWVLFPTILSVGLWLILTIVIIILTVIINRN